MKTELNVRDNSRVAIVRDEGAVIHTTQDALDLMSDTRHLHDTDKLLVHREQFTPEFFDLSTGLAGEILQKYTNYGVTIAIVGDFTDAGKSLRDFIYESNKGGRVSFLSTEEDALNHLHSV